MQKFEPTLHLFLVSQYKAKSNSACPTLTNLKSGEFNPPEIKPLDKLKFDYKTSCPFAIK